MDSRVCQVSPEYQECQVTKVPEVFQAQLVSQAPWDPREIRVTAETSDQWDPPERWDLVVSPGQEDAQAPLDPPVCQEARGLRGPREIRAPLDHQGPQDRLDLEGKWAPQDPPVP